MGVLLDTHALIWWLGGNENLSLRARTAILSSEVFVSAASAWEIATKHRVGKLPQAAEWVGRLAEYLAMQEFRDLPISLAHAELAGRLVGDHRDPFDRMLIAQALADKLTLISNERVFDAFGVSRLW